MEMKVSFELDMKNVYDSKIVTPFGYLLFDGYTENGTRVHILDNHIDAPFIWRNAMMFGTNHIEIEEWK